MLLACGIVVGKIKLHQKCKYSIIQTQFPLSAWKLSDVTMVKTTNNIYLLALCYFHSLKDERIHAYNSMRPSSEPTADPEPEPSADLQ